MKFNIRVCTANTQISMRLEMLDKCEYLGNGNNWFLIQVHNEKSKLDEVPLG